MQWQRGAFDLAREAKFLQCRHATMAQPLYHCSNSLKSFSLIFPAVWYHGHMDSDCDLCPVKRTKKYILKSCLNHCIALMSCTHEPGPLISFFFIDEGGEIRVIVIHAQYREQRSTLSTVHTKYRKCSCVKKLGPKTLTTPLDRLFLEDGTFVEFFSFSAHAEDVDCRGCICL